MTRSNPDPIGKPSGIADAFTTLGEVLTGRRHGTRPPSARCEDAGHRYQVVGRHKPTEIRCAEPGCGAGPWMVGGAR